MNDFPSASGIIRTVLRIGVPLYLITLLWTGSGQDFLGTVKSGWKTPSLPACEANEKLFPREGTVTEGTSLVDRWSKLYHDRVRLVVDEHIRQLQIGSTCGTSARTNPSPALELLGKDLGRDDVHQEDFATLLLRYLETYECALQSEEFVVEAQAENVLANRKKQKNEQYTFGILDFQEEVQRERSQIAQELRIARSANHRTLVYLSGYGRFQPLNSALQCLMGATVDIRNSLDLAAEASACLPRIWDAKTSLRTLYSP